MTRVGKHINGLDVARFEAPTAEREEIASQRLRVTRNVDQTRHVDVANVLKRLG